ncbi:Mutator-like transposase-like protein [Zostera marina]|uniref:Mutator-like transposase-like protein n=1 Tax=Zostera marina TaxID=29655 RepID=A0A0K9NH21_ZOSMR|nr:Mutator-like transposase-like protein [Zostera marina]
MANNSLAPIPDSGDEALIISDQTLIVPDQTMMIISDQSLSVGQEFPDVETCRRTLKEIAISLHFDLRIVKSDRSRFIAKCSKEGCPWRVHVAKCPGLSTFSIRTLQPQHTCEGVQNLHHQQASVGWVARSVEAQLRDNPQYKPKEILEDIREKHGVAVSYMQAWRGKERSMAAVHGTFEEGYRLLPSYCDQLIQMNPGSIALYYTTGQDNCFERLFISYQASIYGFLNACRPLLELDRAELKGKYLGSLLCASAIDAEDTVFPLAFAIVGSESGDNWMWFLSELRKLLGLNTDKMPVLTILSDRQKGIVEAVETHFPASFHGFCLRFISENFRDEFKNSKLVNIFWNAVYALTTTEFDVKINEMMAISQDIMQWLLHFPPNLWAVSCFEGVRYGHFTLGVTELLYNWALEGHELPIVQMMERIRHQLTTWFDERRNLGMSLTSILVPSAEKLISEAMSDSHCYQVLRANKVEFEIVSSERTNIVNIQSHCCSCRRWQIYGVPCAHAAAALISCGEDVRHYAQECFSVGKYCETYSQVINPIPDKSAWKQIVVLPGEETTDIVIHPPKTRRPPGRPKKKVPRIENFKRPKRVVQCGRCHLLGHSQKKCSLPN